MADAPEVELEEIYAGKRYNLRRGTVPGANSYVIFFEARREEAGFDRAADVARRCMSFGFNFIGLTSVLPDFYQFPEIDEVLQVIVAATEGYRRIGYGQSMGAFGILNYFTLLKLDHVVAIAPQATLHRALIPWEKREPKLEHLMADRGIKLDRVFTLQNPPYPSGVIMFDPYHIDAKHAALVRSRHPALVPLPASFAGHLPFGVLNERNMSDKWLRKLLANKFDRAEFLRDWHKIRSNSGRVWFTAAKSELAHKRPRTAMALYRRAIATQKNFYEAQYDLADVLVDHAQFPEALELMRSLLNSPKYRERVRVVLNKLVRSVPDREIVHECRQLLEQYAAPGSELIQAKAAAVQWIFGR